MRFAVNRIGDEGAKQLAKGLANNTTLTALDLRGTRCCSVPPALVCNRNPSLAFALAVTLDLMLTLTSHDSRMHMHTYVCVVAP